MNLWEGEKALSEARRFCELWGIEGTVLADLDGAVARRLGVRGVPTNVFVDGGTIVGVGGVTPADLEAMARRLVGADLTPQVEHDWHWGKEQDHIEQHIARWEQGDERRA